MSGSLDDRLERLRDALAAPRPVSDDVTARPPRAPAEASPARASVALVLRPGSTDLDLLLIKRATRAGDPWSGHMAFPGGRRGGEDQDDLATAVRETREEVGIDLGSAGRYLGSLEAVKPQSGAPPVLISPFVFWVPERTCTLINHEVALALWVPVSTLAAPGAATEYLHALASGEQLRFPAIGVGEHVVWGLTHRILLQFLAIARIGAEQERLT